MFGPFAEKDLDALLHSATLNSLALTAMCHVSIPYIKRGGSIVNMGVKNPDGSICYVIGVLKAIRRSLNKGEGDTIRVVIEVL